MVLDGDRLLEVSDKTSLQRSCLQHRGHKWPIKFTPGVYIYTVYLYKKYIHKYREREAFASHERLAVLSSQVYKYGDDFGCPWIHHFTGPPKKVVFTDLKNDLRVMDQS